MLQTRALQVRAVSRGVRRRDWEDHAWLLQSLLGLMASACAGKRATREGELVSGPVPGDLSGDADVFVSVIHDAFYEKAALCHYYEPRVARVIERWVWAGSEKTEIIWSAERVTC